MLMPLLLFLPPAPARTSLSPPSCWPPMRLGILARSAAALLHLASPSSSTPRIPASFSLTYLHSHSHAHPTSISHPPPSLSPSSCPSSPSSSSLPDPRPPWWSVAAAPAPSPRRRGRWCSPPTSTPALPWYLTLLLRLLMERPEGALGPGRHARLLLVPPPAGALARRLLIGSGGSIPICLAAVMGRRDDAHTRAALSLPATPPPPCPLLRISAAWCCPCRPCCSSLIRIGMGMETRMRSSSSSSSTSTSTSSSTSSTPPVSPSLSVSRSRPRFSPPAAPPSSPHPRGGRRRSFSDHHRDSGRHRRHRRHYHDHGGHHRRRGR